MSRDLEDNSYYITHGGKIPVKWTAPEVWHSNLDDVDNSKASILIYITLLALFVLCYCLVYHYRPSTLGSTPLPVMCGALVVSCMRYGVSDTNRSKPIPIFRYFIIIMHPHTI